jgi:hypothetical protein
MGRYSNIEVRTTDTGKKYYSNVIYPEIEYSDDDIYVIAVDGDRYDKLALQFYHNSDYWWIIAANNRVAEAGSITITPGTQIRIPANPERYITQYNQLNSK